MPWWVPCAKNMNSLFFAIILMKNENEKEIVLLLKPMTKTSQLNGKSKEDFFIMRTLSQMAFQDGRLEGVFSWIVSIG